LSTGASRRRFERIPVRVKLLVTVGEGVYEKSVPLECRDISGGGLSFETATRLPVEADSRIVVGRLGNMPEGARIHGRVAYRDEDEATGRYTVGVEFEEFVNTTRDALIERIHGWQGAHHRSPGVS